jgi:hypothetical protein
MVHAMTQRTPFQRPQRALGTDRVEEVEELIHQLSPASNRPGRYDRPGSPFGAGKLNRGIVDHPIRLNRRPCLSCGVASRGYECRQCREVCCMRCLSELPDSHCPRCRGSLAPQKSCFVCGLVPLHNVGISGDLDTCCASCHVNFCRECRKLLPTRSYLRFFTTGICPWCSGSLVDPLLARLTPASPTRR